MDDMWTTRPFAKIIGPEVTIHFHQENGELKVGVLVDVDENQEGNYEVSAPLLDTFLPQDYDNDGLERFALLLEQAAAKVRSQKS
jgi:hypothetical protein